MSRRRRATFLSVVAELEDRRLLAPLGDITASGIGQRSDESFDYVGTSELYAAPRKDNGSNTVGNDYQDIRISLTGLNAGEQVRRIEAYYGARGHTWVYNFDDGPDAPNNRFEGTAYLDRINDTYTTANLFLEPWFDMDAGATINWVKVYYEDGKILRDETGSFTLATAVNKNKRVSGPTTPDSRQLGTTWVSQATANTDLTGQGMTTGPDGNRDVRLNVTNLSRRRNTNGVADVGAGSEKDSYSIFLAKVAIADVRDASGRLLLENADKEPWDFAGWRSTRATNGFPNGYRLPTSGSFSNALLINRRAMASPLAEETDQADLYFSPDGALSGQALTLIVQYNGADRDNKFDVVAVTPGSTTAADPWNNYGAWTAPSAFAGSAAWAGQDTDGDWRNNHATFNSAGVRPGDVRVNLTGAVASTLTETNLSNQHGSVWTQGQSGTSRLVVVADPANSANSVLFFPPARDESRADLDDPGADSANRNARLTLRFTVSASNRYYEQFSGGFADIGLREQTTVASPKTIEVGSTTTNGTVDILDNGGLTALPNSIVLTDLLKSNTAYPQVTRIRFRPGTYTFPGMVEIERPITLDATSTDPTTTTLRWTQRVAETSINPPATDPKASSPIVINSNDVTLRGFTLKNDTDLNWDAGFNGGDALVSIQDGLVDVVIDGMRLIGPKPSNSTLRNNPRLVSTGHSSGTITNSDLRGGTTYLSGGPWTVSNNDYRGARPNTFTSDAFKLLLYHDVTLTGNEVYDDLNFPGEVGQVGRTHRFLLAGDSDNVSGFGNLISGNLVNQHPQGSSRGWIGLRANGSGIPSGIDPNHPEMILAESYQPFFEGTGYQLSTDRQTLRISYRVGKPLRAGDVVAILDGSSAGRWIRVAQVIDNATSPTSNPTTSTVLLDEAVPGSGNPAIGVHRGYVDSAFRANKIDISDASLHANRTALSLPGNQYDLEVGGDQEIEGNEFVGGTAFKVTSYKTQVPDSNSVGPFPAPDVWTRTPAFDVRIENNTLVNITTALVGPSFEWSPSPTIGRRYFEGVMRENTVRWTTGSPPVLKMGIGDSMFTSTNFGWLKPADDVLSDGYLTFERNWSEPPATTPEARAEIKVNWGTIEGPDQPDAETRTITLGKEPPPPSNAPITVDDGDSAFTATTVGGGFWTTSATGYGTPTDSRSALGGPVTFTATAEWTFGSLALGRYKVLVTWPSASGNASNAPFTVLDGTTSILGAPIRVNQQVSPGGSVGGWEQLGGAGGTFDLVRSTTLKVQLTNTATNGAVVADAVRVEYVGPLLTIDDDGDGTASAGFSTTGSWASYAGSGNGNDHRALQRVNAPNGAKAVPTGTARWTFDGLANGRYRVWVTYVSANNRSRNAPYVVGDGSGGLRTIRLDQQTGPDDMYDSSNRGWERLGGGSALYDVNASVLTVELRNDADSSTLSTDGYVVADAVRVERVGDLAVDNDGGTATAGTTGFAYTIGSGSSWTTWSGAGYDGDHATAAVTGNPAAAATAKSAWTFADLVPGQYRVWVTWVSDGLRTKDAPFTVLDGATPIGTYRLDQSQDPSSAGLVGYYGPSTWQVLDDTFDIAGSTLVVELGNNASFGPASAARVVVADAIRIERVGATVSDHDAPSGTMTGNWDYWSGTGYDGDHATANGNGTSTPSATASWAFRDLAPGRYQVWATWVHSGNRATNAPFTVKQGTGTPVALPAVNQSTNTNDAAYPFDYYQGLSWRILDTVEVDNPLVTIALGNHVPSGKVVVADGVRLVRVSPLYADDGSRHVAMAGNWTKYDHPTAIPGLHGDHSVAPGAVTADATATWTFAGLRPGSYRVWAAWVESPGRATNAKYRIYNTTLTDPPAVIATVNQRLAPAQTPQQVYKFDEDANVSWKQLTSVILATGRSTIFVKLGNDADGQVVADGVWLERL